jgi:hypothetical protein
MPDPRQEPGGMQREARRASLAKCVLYYSTHLASETKGLHGTPDRSHAGAQDRINDATPCGYPPHMRAAISRSSAPIAWR